VAPSGTDACLDNIITALTSDPRRLEYLVGITIDVHDVAASAVSRRMVERALTSCRSPFGECALAAALEIPGPDWRPG